MRETLRAMLCIVMLINSIPLTGCGTRRAINPGTGIVDVRVWCMLDFGESRGVRTNNGSRLTTSEMVEIVRQLERSAVVFGHGTRFRWPGSIINDVESVYLSGRTNDFNSLLNDIWFNDLLGTPIRNPFAVNIYFGGNYTSGGGQLYGGTLDPEANIDSSLILVNDAGFMGGGANPPVLLDRLTGPHEMAHYLARFELVCFGPRCYDDGEHSTSHSSLLNAGVPRPLYMPGDRDDTTTERGQIYDRVIRGRWNLP